MIGKNLKEINIFTSSVYILVPKVLLLELSAFFLQLGQHRGLLLSTLTSDRLLGAVRRCIRARPILKRGFLETLFLSLSLPDQRCCHYFDARWQLVVGF